MRIEGSVVLVTGGASGLGAATVRAVVARGGRAAILDLPSSAGAALAEELGSAALFVPADVTRPEQVTAAVQQTVAAFGALHVAVNCAGVGSAMKITGKQGPMPLELFEMVIRINLTGTFDVSRLAATEMLKNSRNDDGERGVIVNTASVAAFEGQAGQVAYAAAKGGIAAMTLVIARDLARDGIRCCTVAPGIFDTPMIGLMPDAMRQAIAAQTLCPARLGQPTEYAALACHIVENPMLNGETIRLDGGLRLPPK